MAACPAFLAGSLGPAELLVLFVVILLLFGPKRLPEIARMIAKAMDHMRRASQDFHDQVMDIEKEVMAEPPTASPPAIEAGVLREDEAGEEDAPSDRPADAAAG